MISRGTEAQRKPELCLVRKAFRTRFDPLKDVHDRLPGRGKDRQSTAELLGGQLHRRRDRGIATVDQRLQDAAVGNDPQLHESGCQRRIPFGIGQKPERGISEIVALEDLFDKELASVGRIPPVKEVGSR